MNVAVGVRLHEPCFAAGSQLVATVALSRSDASHDVEHSAQSVSSEKVNALTDSVSDSATGRGLSFPTSLLSFRPVLARSDPSARAPQTIDFVVAQVTGRWTADRSWIRPGAHNDAVRNEDRNEFLDAHDTTDAPWDSALADANHIGGGGRVGYSGLVFRSRALVICRSEPIPPGVDTSFTVRCVLPDNIPATFRGTGMRYGYTLVVAAAMPGATPQCLRVPFRVVPSEAAVIGRPLSNPIPVPTPAKIGPLRSRFLEESPLAPLAMSAELNKNSATSDIEIALAMSANGRLTPFRTDEEMWQSGSSALEDDSELSLIRHLPPDAAAGHDGQSTPQRSTTGTNREVQRGRARGRTTIPMYQISRGPQFIARMFMHRKVHYLGDTLTATFDFRGNAARCYRIDARLECQEIVRSEHAVNRASQPQMENEATFRKIYGEHGEFIQFSHNTHVTFSIPHDAPVSFATEVIEVKWLMHFMFLVEKMQTGEPFSSTNGTNGGTNESNGAHDPLLSHSSTPVDEQQTRTGRIAGDAARGSVQAIPSDIRGWEGGEWRGDDPNVWPQIPARTCDVLRWTLPLTVTGHENRKWGRCPSMQLNLITA